MTDAAHAVEKRDLVVTRQFNAAVERVWQAWTDPQLVTRWWGPYGFTAPVARMDVREGGTSLVCMRSPQGQDFYHTWTYRRVVPMQRLEFVMDLADDNGKRALDPVRMGLPPDFPRDVRHVVAFQASSDNTTELTVTEFGYTSDQLFEISKLGLEQCLEKMAASLATP
jgi:uncharacterized protein YndB with AHSA1/START domain